MYHILSTTIINLISINNVVLIIVVHQLSITITSTSLSLLSSSLLLPTITYLKLQHHYAYQDISVPEAVPLSDFDETAIRSSFAEATSLLNSSSDGSTDKVTAMIQLNTFRYDDDNDH